MSTPHPVLPAETDEAAAARHDHSACVNESRYQTPVWYYVFYVLWGALFGIVFVKAEIVSWYRIQEMFRLQSFHMYGVIGSAVATAALSVWLLKKFNVKTLENEAIVINQRPDGKGVIYGGLLFGFGWALTGACPGPMYALVGTGNLSFIIVIASALAGVYTYGLVKDRLPE
jgi:uncharacterized membrane protein YedE/YeeE